MTTKSRLESRVIPIDIDITWAATTPSFTFIGPGNVVSTSGEISLIGHAKHVVLLFNLVSKGGEHFDEEHPMAVEEITSGGPIPCPIQAAGLTGPFSDATTDASHRLLVVSDDNHATTKKKYQYALFFRDSINNIFPCDPRIINN